MPFFPSLLFPFSCTVSAAPVAAPAAASTHTVGIVVIPYSYRSPRQVGNSAGVQAFTPLPTAHGHPRDGARLGHLPSTSSAQGGRDTLAQSGESRSSDERRKLSFLPVRLGAATTSPEERCEQDEDDDNVDEEDDMADSSSDEQGEDHISFKKRSSPIQPNKDLEEQWLELIERFKAKDKSKHVLISTTPMKAMTPPPPLTKKQKRTPSRAGSGTTFS